MGNLATSTALLLATFLTGYGEYAPGAGGMASLTRDEERYVERVVPQLDECAEQDCRNAVALAIVEVINLRRALNAEFVGSALFDSLRRPCDNLDSALAQRDCYLDRADLSFEQAMHLAGFARHGLTMEGYSSLRRGMRLDEVEFVLGAPGTEVSYASAGGSSASMYRWGEGSRVIAVTFMDYELSARSQAGL